MIVHFEFCPLFSTVVVPQTMDVADTQAADGCRIIIVEGENDFFTFVAYGIPDLQESHA
jgi:hypothetical protein